MATVLTLPVHGMTCGGCENAVTRAVGMMPGVTAVTASHKDAQVVVSYDPALLSRVAITEKIARLGYSVGGG